MLIERGQQIAPGVGFGHGPGGSDSQFSQRRNRLRTSGHRLNVRQRIEKPLLIDVPLDDGHQMTHAHTRHEDHDIHAPRDQFVRELDHVGTIGQRHFPHRRADKRLASVALDQPLSFLGAATLESKHLKSVEIL